MRILDLDSCGIDDAIEQCAAALIAGDAIVYPTDTVYALAVLPSLRQGVEAAYKAKKRAAEKPLSLCVSGLKQAEDYVIVDDKAQAVANAFLPGPLTMICKARNTRLEQVHIGRSGIGIRLPDHPFGPLLAERLNCPITATSANLAGAPPATDRESAIAAFANADEGPTILIDGGRSKLGTPSTVVDVSTEEVQLIREGAIPFDKILSAVAKEN